ncbi:MAG: rod shape-determining protein MreC [Candidatus Omnitrophica bacterium]|nr:rod shape-determining protein MreC [Candidatus Omnitrophota bacterium]
MRFQDLTEENARLQNEINQLKAQTAQLQEASLENQRLRNLLSLPQGTQFKSISALVVAKDSSNLTRTIVISQGSLNGVKPGMSVIFGAGLVGRVIETFPGSSKVALLTDFNSKIPAKIQRTREEGVVLGTLKPGQNICQIKYIHDAQIGDKVISSGLGGRCPKGLLIGEIIAVTDDESGLYKIAQIRSEVDFSTLEEAMIILE